MRPALSLRFILSLLCLTSASVLAAKKSPEPAEAAPQLISTKGGGPKWKNVIELQAHAADGDPQACFELAERCQEGEGVPRDIDKAAVLFEKAAKGGIANGWFRLGKIYHDGLAGAPDYTRALEYFTNAARAGVVEAQHNIGAMLVSARGVKRNYIEGLAWLTVAEKAGDPSESAAQVRNRLAKRPADLAAATARAEEINSDLANAIVQTGVVAPPTDAPAKPTPPSLFPSTEKPSIVVPRLEPGAPPKIEMPLPPPTTTPGKP